MRSGAQLLSQWLENTHPELFHMLHAKAQAAYAHATLQRARLRGFGDDGLDEYTIDPPESLDFGSGSSDYTVDIPTLSESDLSNPISDVDLSSIGSGVNAGISPIEAGSLDVATDQSSGGFLQSIGSGISSAAGAVGNFLTSPQGLSTIANLGQAYFQLQNNKVNAQVQNSILQAQVARISAGGLPAPITYVRGSNGQLVPVYSAPPAYTTAAGGIVTPGSMPPALANAIATGQAQLVTLPDGSTGYTIPPSILGSLGGNTSLSDMLPWILLILGGALLLRR